MGNTVLITGAASGFGRAAADYFAERGWNVAATARTPSALDGWVNEGNRWTVRLDVTNPASIRAAVEATLERFGQIDVLVNNAGFGVYGPLEGAVGGELEQLFQTNVFGAAAMIRAVLPGMRARGTGTIVNVSSLGGRMGAPFMSLYAASKFALEGLSESLRYELMAHGIRVKLVEPGHFKTDFLSRSLREVTHEAYEGRFRNHMGWVHQSNETAPGPEPVAAAIFRAATDGTTRLHYPVNASTIIALSRLLPDGVFRRMVGVSMTRPARAIPADAQPR